MLAENGPLQNHYQQRRQKQEDRDPVDPVHVFHPLRMRRSGISFLQIKIFCDLTEHAHISGFEGKLQRIFKPAPNC